MSERERQDGDDPTAIFALLRDVEIPDALLAAVSAGVSAELDREVARRPWLRPAAAWAAAAVLALAVLLPAARRQQPLTPVTAVAPVVSTIADAPRAGIESLRTPGPAQVLDLTVGDTQVVMIFDAELAL